MLIPGVQGRWEWMAPTIEALSRHCRVLTNSLPGDPGSLARLDPTRGFDLHVSWLDTLLTQARLERAVMCGVSYGGLVALRYAAARPERTQALALVSTPSPSWRPNCRIERYLAAPRLMSPIFALSSPFRLYPEIASAFPDIVPRTRFAVRHLARVIAYPFRPTRMAARVRLIETAAFSEDCVRVEAPTLVVTGEPDLDRVVAVDDTRQYVTAITGAATAEIERTGHIGFATRPEVFAGIIASFANAQAAPTLRRSSAATSVSA